MKNLFKLFAAIAVIALSFASCQKEIENTKEEITVTHSVKFAAENPATKTSATIVTENGEKFVDYDWKESDQTTEGVDEKFHVFENGESATSIEAVLMDGQMMIEAHFPGESAPANAEYTGYFNAGILASQSAAGDDYDQLSDVLVAKATTTIESDILLFQFKRLGSIGEMNLKGLEAGVKLKSVVLRSYDGTMLAGTFDRATGEIVGSSKSITINTENAIVDNNAKVRFVSLPVDEAKLQVIVETANEDGTLAGTYVKTFAKPITLPRGDLKAFNVSSFTDGVYFIDKFSDNDGTGGNDGKFSGSIASNSIKSDNADWSFTEGSGANKCIKLGTGSRLGSATTPAISAVGDAILTFKAAAWDTNSESTVLKISATNATLESATVDIKKAEWTEFRINVTNISEGATFTFAGNKSSDSRFFLDNVALYAGAFPDMSDPAIRVSGVTVSPSSASIEINGTVELLAIVTPNNATDQSVTWTSNDSGVASVDAETGVVTGHAVGDAVITATTTDGAFTSTCTVSVVSGAAAKTDNINRAFTGVESGASSYSAWSNKEGTSGAIYAGNSAGSNDAVQLRTTYSNSGVVVTSNPNGTNARKVVLVWESHTSTGRVINVYGKNSAYTAASDLYDNTKQGDLIGSITYGTSTELDITSDYQFIGIRSDNSAVYLTNIAITWEPAKSARESLGFYSGETKVTEPLSATVGDSFTAPVLKDNNGVIEGAIYTSSATDVADFVEGVLTLKKKGTTTIKATVPATAEYAAGEASYTLNVGNKLTGLALANDSAHATSFYEGDKFSFVGIKLVASYNDETTKNLAAGDLEASNFSGFDSSTAVAEQKITVSYTDNGTASCQYNIEIKPLVTLYNITVPGTDGQGNSVVVKGGAAKAAENETVTLVVTPTTGYYLTSLKVNGGSELCTDDNKNGGEVAFTMPAGAATVTASFSNLYTVSLTQPDENGTVKVAGTTTASQTFAYGATVNVVAEPADGYELNEWTVIGATLADASAASTSFTMPKNNVSVTASFKVHVASVHDVLTNADLAATSNAYTNFTNVSKNTAVYAGQSSKNNGIQLRATNPSGIVTTTSGGKIKTVTVKWNSNCAAGRILDVYGKNSAYSTAADLYSSNSNTQGTKIGSITQGISTSLTVSTDYAYVGVRSNNGALNIDEIDFEWGGGDTPPSPTTLGVPTNLQSSNVTQTTATLTWTAVSNASGYKVKIGSKEYDANTNSFSATDLTKSTEYTWSVRAVGDGVYYESSGYAPDQKFTTSAGSGGGSVTFTAGTDTSTGTSITKGGITLTATTFNNASYYQAYSGTPLKVDSTVGNIKEIEITFIASGTANYGPSKVGTVTVGSYTYSGKVGTWKGDASSVTLPTTAQIRMASVKVTYGD